MSKFPWIRTESEQITDLHNSNNEKLQEIRDLRKEAALWRGRYLSLNRKVRRG